MNIEKILRILPADIVVFDVTHRYLYISPFSIKDDDLRHWLIGKTDFDYCIRRNKPESIAANRRIKFNQCISERTEVSFIESLVTSTGKTKYFSRKMYPYINQLQEIEFVLGFGIEITEFWELEVANKKLLETLLTTESQKVNGCIARLGGALDVVKLYKKDMSPEHQLYCKMVDEEIQQLNTNIFEIVSLIQKHLNLISY